jgi:hypothetical protein
VKAIGITLTGGQVASIASIEGAESLTVPNMVAKEL